MKISIDDIQKNFGEKRAVDIAHFSHEGEGVLGLVGNNGAGKTTLFRIILDLLKADTGAVTLHFDDGEEINPAMSEAWKDHTGAYIDEGFLIDFLSPEEYFTFIAKVCGIDEDTRQERMKTFEAFMGGEVMGQKKLIRDFSAGNKQKIGIIAAMLNQPQLLILDEPFNFLDPRSQNVLKRLLTNYAAEHHATVLVSSHNLNHTVDISERILLMEQGHLIRDIDNADGAARREIEQYFMGEEEEYTKEERNTKEEDNDKD